MNSNRRVGPARPRRAPAHHKREFQRQRWAGARYAILSHPPVVAPSGFTLLEVILALTILAGALAVLGEVSRLALRNAAAARDLARAQLLAESKLAEIEAGITSTDSVENTAIDPSTESLDRAEPGWLYSISSQPTDEDGVLSVRVTVTRDLPAGQHPVKFTLARWLPDPNYTYTPPASDASSSSGTSGGS